MLSQQRLALFNGVPGANPSPVIGGHEPPAASIQLDTAGAKRSSAPRGLTVLRQVLVPNTAGKVDRAECPQRITRLHYHLVGDDVFARDLVNVRLDFTLTRDQIVTIGSGARCRARRRTRPGAMTIAFSLTLPLQRIERPHEPSRRNSEALLGYAGAYELADAFNFNNARLLHQGTWREVAERVVRLAVRGSAGLPRAAAGLAVFEQIEAAPFRRRQWIDAIEGHAVSSRS